MLQSTVACWVAMTAKADQVWARATMVQAAKADTAVAESAAGRTAAAEAEEDLDTIPTESLERIAAIAPADVGSGRDCLLPLAEEPVARARQASARPHCRASSHRD